MYLLCIVFYGIIYHCIQLINGTCSPPSDYTLRYAVVEKGNSLQTRQLQKSSNLKIIIFYTSYFNQLNDSNVIKTKIIFPAVKFWQNSLKVRNASSDLFYVQRYCEDNSYYYFRNNGTKYCDRSQCRRTEKCQNVDIPIEYMSECYQKVSGHLTLRYNKGKGLSRNSYLLIVDSQNKGSCYSGVTNAFAGACITDPNTDRPLIGYVNFCPLKTSMKYPRNRVLLGTAKHEIAHALGFARQHFAFMRERDGTPRTERDPTTKKPLHQDQYGIYTPSDKTVKEINRTWVSAVGTYYKVFASFVTESLLKEAKKHFGCPSLDGVDLEDEGGSGSKNSHFKGRLFATELMASNIEIDAYASRVTFAFFEDSGWYDVNYTRAEKWIYGKNLGCTFSMESCYAYANSERSKKKSILPYCDQPRIVTCRDDFSYGVCDIGRYNHPLPPEDQFFDKTSFAGSDADHYGGTDSFKNKCPTIGYLLQLGQLNVTSFCTHDENNKIADSESNFYLQSFAKNAICVKHAGSWTYEHGGYIYSLDQNIKGTCHKYICKEKKLIVDFKGSRVTCPQSGGKHHFTFNHTGKLYRGSIECPLANRFCK
ncbi:Leishmanolysin-like peptidase isoform 2 [Schistosoma japonicum]|uniref:Leishmanolysin-like peptidase n=1 Tax=Schistosoma japonicum TaxID=6182 RepID=A0A4Z2DNQ5_SCHJA|nr:Leishmanolysin-like peptidase isoform 2 [Schistosoma japonicum]